MTASGSRVARTAARYVSGTRHHGKQAGKPGGDQQDWPPGDHPSRPDGHPSGWPGGDHPSRPDGDQFGGQAGQRPARNAPGEQRSGRRLLVGTPGPLRGRESGEPGGRSSRQLRGRASRRARKLSLRARMLVMLVGVTTILLLVMGAVSTYLVVLRVDAQLADIGNRLTELAAYLRTDPADAAKPREEALAAGLAGSAVVEIPLSPHLAVVPLSPHGRLTTEVAAAVRQQLSGARLRAVEDLAADHQLLQARDVLLSRGCARFPFVSPAGGCKPVVIGRDIEVASRWAPAAGPIGHPVPDSGAVVLVAQPVGNVRNQVRGFIIAELVTGTALIALLAVGGEWLIGRGLGPLDEMTRTADDITSRGDLTARMPDADDQTEVGRLGSSINTMLDRIQQAFGARLRSEQKVREFAADASHELRTPLTTIRGYAELYRQGALGPDQLPNAMRRIEQESERMSTLVAELLELARLDRTSSLDLTETDLAGIVRDAVADAIAVEPERPVRAEAPPRLVAVVDEPRIRQVLANLLGNVRAHTPLHTPVAVRLGPITGGVLIEVADAGPGMSTEDAIRAFDRFHRATDPWAGWEGQDINLDGNEAASASAPRDPAAGDNSGQDSPDGSSGSPRGSARAERTSGAGLGLSIVQAIASAHGGRATLESYTGQGTKVRVWLPVRIVP